MASNKRKSSIIHIPGSTLIYQPNRITEGRFRGFNGIHNNILSAIIKEFQVIIKHQIFGDGKPEQLELFQPDNNNEIAINLRLSDFSIASNYKNTIKAINELATLSINIDEAFATPDLRKKYTFRRPLFTKMGIPRKLNGKSFYQVYLHKEVAEQLVTLKKNRNGQSVEYTTYIWEVSMKFTGKHTTRLYWLLSSWKRVDGGGFRKSLKEIKELLWIEENQYKNYSDFKKRVLVPAMEEMKEKGDLWFNCAADDFEEYDTKTGKVIFLNFKIIRRKDKSKLNERFDNIRQMLRTHLAFQKDELDNLLPVFNCDADTDDIVVKVIELIEYVKDLKNNIGNKPAYLTKSLLNHFKDYL